MSTALFDLGLLIVGCTIVQGARAMFRSGDGWEGSWTLAACYVAGVLLIATGAYLA